MIVKFANLTVVFNSIWSTEFQIKQEIKIKWFLFNAVRNEMVWNLDVCETIVSFALYVILFVAFEYKLNMNYCTTYHNIITLLVIKRLKVELSEIDIGPEMSEPLGTAHKWRHQLFLQHFDPFGPAHFTSFLLLCIINVSLIFFAL